MLNQLLKIFYKSRFGFFRRGRLFRKKSALFTLFGLVMVPALIFLQTADMFAAWLLYPNMGEAFLLRFVTISFLGILILLILTGVPNVLHHFFLAPDLALLAALPLPPKVIYTLKLIEAAANNLGMYVAIGLPLLFSMCYVLQASLLAYVVLFFTSFLFILIPTGLAAILAFLFAGLFSIKNMRRFSTLILGFFIIALWVVLQFVRLSRLNPLAAEFEPEALMNFSRLGHFYDRLVLPHDWIVAGVYAVSNGQVVAAVFNLGLLVLLSALLLWVTISWRARLATKDMRIDAVSRKAKPVAGPVFALHPVRLAYALFAKDNRLVFRDPRFLQSTVLLTVMFIVAPLVTRTEPDMPQGTFEHYLPYVPITILTLIAASFMARQALPIERLSFVYLLQAPIRPTIIIVLKTLRLLLIVGPPVIISLLFAVLKTGASAALFIKLVIGHLLFIVGSAVLGLMISISSTHFDWTDPRYMVSTAGQYLGTFLTLLLGGLGVGLYCAGLTIGDQIIAFLLFFVYFLAVFGLSLRMAKARLSKLEWIY